MESVRLYLGKCENILKQFESDSIDSMVTDPPAGINFMNKNWDKDHGGRDRWIEYMTGIFEQCLRILKPGAHALVWALPRTSHWTATALEDAGFEIRDIINHIFGSGFPKSLDISKAIDKMQKAQRPIIGISSGPNNSQYEGERYTEKRQTKFGVVQDQPKATSSVTNEAKQWDGWGTALKPACEHWILCRKPIAEKNIAENVLKWRCGGLNIDGCRVFTNEIKENNSDYSDRGFWNNAKPNGERRWNGNGTNNFQGRFPSNVIHDGSEEVLAGFPNTNGDSLNRKPRGNIATNGITCFGTSKNNKPNRIDSGSAARFFYNTGVKEDDIEWIGDGTYVGLCEECDLWTLIELDNPVCAKCGKPVIEIKEQIFPRPKESLQLENFSRMFYCAKASKRDRDEGLDDFFWYKTNQNSKWQRISKKEYFRLKDENDVAEKDGEKPKHIINTGSVHETVKATPLMQYLCRLITPPGGTVVDPFMGSGSTGKAAILEGFGFYGIENEKDYFDMAEARIYFTKNKKDNQYKLAI